MAAAGSLWQWLGAIDGTTNGGENICVLTPFRQWNGSWRSVSLSLRRSVGAGVVVPAEKFNSPPPCILSAPWSTRCLKHASLVSFPCCKAISSFSDKRTLCVSLFWFYWLCKDVVWVIIISYHDVLVAATGGDRKTPCLSVNILLEHSVTLRKSWCVFSVRISGGDCWVIMGTSCWILVDCFPLYCCLICPLMVVSVLGRYLLTSSTVSPGQDAKEFLLIASTKVRFVGLKHAAW